MKGKNERQVERKRTRRLEALLSKNDTVAQRKTVQRKQFADPADFFK